MASWAGMRWRVVGVVAAGFLPLSACGGRGAAAGAESTVAGRTTSDSTSATAVPTSEASAYQDLIDALQDVLLPRPSGTAGLPAPEPACFDRQVDAAGQAANAAAAQLVADPTGWQNLADEDVHPLVQAYVGCADLDAVLTAVARGTLQSEDDLPCVAAAWKEAGLRADAIVDSVVYGDLLGDLRDPLVDELATRASKCLPDRRWWVDDLAIELNNEQQLSSEQAVCAAEAYIATFGVERMIRHRILTIPELALPPEDQAKLGLEARCGTEVQWPYAGPPAAAAGQCVDDFYADRQKVVVPCDQPHDVEVYAVQDLTTVLAHWPGAKELIERTQTFCGNDGGTAADGRPEWVAVMYEPSRQQWEMGTRRVGCVIARDDRRRWTGSSGLVPVPSTSMPFSSLVAGQCVVGEGLTKGDLGDQQFDVVDCAATHHAEVFYVSDLPDAPGTPYAGDRGTSDRTSAECIPAFDAYVGSHRAETSLATWFFYPSEESWNGGDRHITCYLIGGEGVTVTGSMAGTKR